MIVSNEKLLMLQNARITTFTVSELLWEHQQVGKNTPTVNQIKVDKFHKPANLLKKRLWPRCFRVNFAKFLRTSFCRTPPVAASQRSRFPGSLVSALSIKRISMPCKSQNDLQYQNALINAVAYTLFLLQAFYCSLYSYYNEV